MTPIAPQRLRLFQPSVSKTSVNRPQTAASRLLASRAWSDKPRYRRLARHSQLRSPLGKGRRSHPRLNDNIGSCAGNDSFDLRLLGLGHSELVKSLLKIVEEGFPLCCGDHQILVGVLH